MPKNKKTKMLASVPPTPQQNTSRSATAVSQPMYWCRLTITCRWSSSIHRITAILPCNTSGSPYRLVGCCHQQKLGDKQKQLFTSTTQPLFPTTTDSHARCLAFLTTKNCGQKNIGPTGVSNLLLPQALKSKESFTLLWQLDDGSSTYKIRDPFVDGCHIISEGRGSDKEMGAALTLLTSIILKRQHFYRQLLKRFKDMTTVEIMGSLPFLYLATKGLVAALTHLRARKRGRTKSFDQSFQTRTPAQSGPMAHRILRLHSQ